MRPEAGMDIMKFLQEPCDALTAYQLFNHMVYALQKWIGGITLNLPGCYVNPLPSGNGFDTAFPYTINAVNLQSVGKFVISRPHTSS